MNNGFYMKVEWKDNATTEEKIQAIANVLDFVSREMSIGRVPDNKIELQKNIDLAEQRVTTPLSIAFVKMAEKGEIDEITASENAELFLAWNENSTYAFNDLRKYNGKLYRCLQAHTGQADWTPDVAISLWKLIGVNENGIPEWSQPISGADAYNTGDEVMFNAIHYRSTIDNNVWSPETYPAGWEVVENVG